MGRIVEPVAKSGQSVHHPILAIRSSQRRPLDVVGVSVNRMDRHGLRHGSYEFQKPLLRPWRSLRLAT